MVVETDEKILAWLQKEKLTAKSFAQRLPGWTNALRDGTLPLEKSANHFTNLWPRFQELLQQAADAQKTLDSGSHIDAKQFTETQDNFKEVQRLHNTMLSIMREVCNGCFTRTCWSCDGHDEKVENGGLKKCAGCEIAMYCSRKCQEDHWKKHKPECKTLKAEREGNLRMAKEADPRKHNFFESFQSGRNPFLEVHVSIWCQHCPFASMERLQEKIELVRTGNWWLYGETDKRPLALQHDFKGLPPPRFSGSQGEMQEQAVPVNHVTSLVMFFAGIGSVPVTRAAYEYIWGEAMTTTGVHLSAETFYHRFAGLSAGMGQGAPGRPNLEYLEQWARSFSAIVNPRIEQLQDLGARARLLGPRVQLQSIQSQPDLNGQTGEVLGVDGERLMVRLASGREMKLKEEKVEFLGI